MIEKIMNTVALLNETRSTNKSYAIINTPQNPLQKNARAMLLILSKTNL